MAALGVGSLWAGSNKGETGPGGLLGPLGRSLGSSWALGSVFALLLLLFCCGFAFAVALLPLVCIVYCRFASSIVGFVL